MILTTSRERPACGFDCINTRENRQENIDLQDNTCRNQRQHKQETEKLKNKEKVFIHESGEINMWF